MHRSQPNPYRIKQSFKKYILNTILPILVNGFTIGLIVGFLVWSYNVCAEKITEFTTDIYAAVHTNLFFLPLLILGLGLLAVLMATLLTFIPEVSGSGIPFTEGVMRGQLRYKRLKMFFGTIVGSFISFLAGLPLGAEGPSVQIGGIVGNSVDYTESKLNSNSRAWNRLSITSGASAGLAVAFNAPLTGIIFALEEGHKRFSPTIMLSTASSVIFAVLTSRLLAFGTGIRADVNFWIFDFGQLEMLPMKYIWMLLIVGILIGLFAAVFSLMLSYTKRFMDKFKVQRIYRLLAAFMLMGIVGVFLADVIGGGAGLIRKIVSHNLGIGMLLLVLVAKLFMIALCSTSGTTGGLFVPMLAVGALAGGIICNLLQVIGMPANYYKVIVIVSMSAFMSAVVRAPLTGIILIVEITGQLMSGFLQTAIVIIISYFVVELFEIKPIYDELLESTLENTYRGVKKQIVTFEEIIENGSFVVGRSVRDILWPAGCQVQKIVKVNRQGDIVTRTDKDGERMIHAGDLYVIQAETFNPSRTLQEIHDLTRSHLPFDDQILDLDD